MEVVFTKSQKLGTRHYGKGPQVVPDFLAHSRPFQVLVRSGVIVIQPRDEESQNLQMARDAQAFQQAQARRLESKLSQSAQTATGAFSPQPAPVKAAQPDLLEPISPAALPATAFQEEG